VSQRQLADMTDMGATTINQIEKGKVEPRGSTIEKLTIALDVDPCWLLYGSGTKPKWNEKAEHATERQLSHNVFILINPQCSLVCIAQCAILLKILLGKLFFPQCYQGDLDEF
jgi:transcriptional regulator with XRE-family HTH domain